MHSELNQDLRDKIKFKISSSSIYNQLCRVSDSSFEEKLSLWNQLLSESYFKEKTLQELE